MSTAQARRPVKKASQASQRKVSFRALLKNMERLTLTDAPTALTHAQRQENTARNKKTLERLFGALYLPHVLPKHWLSNRFCLFGRHDNYASCLGKGIESYDVIKRHHLPGGVVETLMEVMHERDEYQFTCGVKMHAKSRPQVPMAS